MASSSRASRSRFRHAGPPRGSDRRQADEELHVRLNLTATGQRAQDTERLFEPAAIDQRPGVDQVSRHVRTGSGRRHGLDHGAPGRDGKQKTGGGRESAKERGDHHMRYFDGCLQDEKKEGGRTCHPHPEL